ncbi:aminotransferase [Exiguobacterium profundum]|uniref:aminotransferase n=1 Tax=Exiguobacterium TaxID=33986 RepID=UPI0012F2DD7A|nr:MULTISPECIES: aminotransferase [Exiguobacterium]QPI68628.1 aminotransferase [Exiguobacterium sp. PBE]MBG0917520.1 aminotransferase [Exiguobacterium sp. SRB7LM]MCT4797462.1 aminotransferase [Exiguobacterium profundum]MCV9899762.1 aminotransferase [Exiguobacterium sp. N5]MDT0192061.1 aminotransferase [Exiguobacterium sp. BG5(2022)]
MKSLSNQVVSMKPSGIRRFFDLAQTMDNVVSLGVGEPDFITPWNVREASYAALEEGYTAYSANAGLIELREEIATYMKERFLVEYDPTSELIVTTGASQALDIAFRALLNPGDEVIVVEPAFVSYGPLIELAGGTVVPVACRPEKGFRLDRDDVEQAITERTKAILLCFPSNPTGATMNGDELAQIAELATKYDLWVVSDEIYAELCYDDPFVSFATLHDMRDRTIVVNGFSKAFAMTGWRLGFTCAPEVVTREMLKVHQYGMMCAPTLVQFGGLEALRTREQHVPSMVKSYRQRRNYFIQALNEAGLPTHVPGGAFYAFPSIRHTGLTSEEFAERLLIEERVAVVPGNAFGESGEGFVRASYATSLEQLQEAILRIQRFMKQFEVTVAKDSHS